VRTALRRGLPILIQIGGDLAAFPDCWAVGVPGGYRLRAPAEPGPATTATLAYLGITPASKRAAGSGHGESPKAAPDTSPPPVVSTAEQHAEQALRTARREVTPAAIAKLAPHPIPHDDHEKRSAWLQLVRGGMTPTPAAVAGLVADKAARRARRVQEAADVAEIAARDGVAAAVAVARIGADTGTGPTWTELRSTLGWPRNASRGIIPKLIQAGWLTSSGDHRSLRPGTATRVAACSARPHRLQSHPRPRLMLVTNWRQPHRVVQCPAVVVAPGAGQVGGDLPAQRCSLVDAHPQVVGPVGNGPVLSSPMWQSAEELVSRHSGAPGTSSVPGVHRYVRSA